MKLAFSCQRTCMLSGHGQGMGRGPKPVLYPNCISIITWLPSKHVCRRNLEQCNLLYNLLFPLLQQAWLTQHLGTPWGPRFWGGHCGPCWSVAGGCWSRLRRAWQQSQEQGCLRSACQQVTSQNSTPSICKGLYKQYWTMFSCSNIAKAAAYLTPS